MATELPAPDGDHDVLNGVMRTAQPSVVSWPPLDPAHTAVVVVDMVNWQVPRAVGETATATPYYVDRLANTVIPNHERLLPACRAAGIPVIYLKVGSFRTDFGDAIPQFRGVFADAGAVQGSYACEVISEIAPQPGDIPLAKTASGGFGSSALDSHLRNMGITHVIYTGVATNCCVFLTLAGGYDLGYNALMVTDATATLMPEFQEQAENLIKFYLAPLVTTDEVLDLIGADVAQLASA
jgi:nicotinamidase-related amidase